MKILAIETSCDETAVALLDIDGPLEKPEIKVLGNTLLSQAELHEAYGGVYPNLAKREHQKNLPILLEQTLKEAREDIKAPQLDFIAVTTGPGLEPALWTGITFAEDLGRRWGKPVVGINHMAGHVYSVLYGIKDKLILPALALLISGGHTELVYMKDFGRYEMLGQTRDDAVGEAFDKVARMLGLPYPGGPQISALALAVRAKNLEPSFKLPRPMINSGDLNFSFSGLKTAVLYKIKAQEKVDEDFKMEMALAFEEAVADVLVAKTRQALESLSDTKTLIVAGGVAANRYLAERLRSLVAEFPDLALLMPEKLLATDNAVMIGIAAYARIKEDSAFLSRSSELKAQGNLKIA